MPSRALACGGRGAPGVFSQAGEDGVGFRFLATGLGAEALELLPQVSVS